MQRSDDLRSDFGLCLRTAADAARLFHRGFFAADHELLQIAHLDGFNNVIALTCHRADKGRLNVPLADILHDVVRHQPHRLVIAHNHPSGDPLPSRQDRATTRRIAEFLREIEVELVDHLIFAAGGITSFRALGLL